jgi:nitrogen regulatory protein P-II 1
MKKIECIIRPEKVDRVIEAIQTIGVRGVTLTDVNGCGKETHKEGKYAILPKTKVEIFAADGQVDEILEAIISIAKTGSFGDGKITISPMDHVVRIRTHEEDEQAIY